MFISSSNEVLDGFFLTMGTSISTKSFAKSTSERGLTKGWSVKPGALSTHLLFFNGALKTSQDH